MTFSLKRKMHECLAASPSKRRRIERNENILKAALIRHFGVETVSAARKIQHWWRYYKRYLVTNQVDEYEQGKDGFVRVGGKNAICPITQDIIPVTQCFKIVIGPNAVLAYTCTDLIEYLTKTCNFECPCTRTTINEPILRRLVRKGMELGVSTTMFLMDRYRHRDMVKRQEIEMANRRLAIEVSCANYMTEILEACANLEANTLQVIVDVQNDLLPSWMELVHQYARFDLPSCKTMLVADKEKITRLVENPEHNPHNILDLVLTIITLKIRWCEGINSGHSFVIDSGSIIDMLTMHFGS